MSEVKLSLSDLEAGSVVIKIDGLLHFYALKSDIKSVHAYIDETRLDCKYTIDVLLGYGEVKLQYSDKELSASVLGMFERVLCVGQADLDVPYLLKPRDVDSKLNHHNINLFEHQGMRDLLENQVPFCGSKMTRDSMVDVTRRSV